MSRIPGDHAGVLIMDVESLPRYPKAGIASKPE